MLRCLTAKKVRRSQEKCINNRMPNCCGETEGNIKVSPNPRQADERAHHGPRPMQPAGRGFGVMLISSNISVRENPENLCRWISGQ